MKNKEISSKQIEYHHETSTWVLKGESLTGTINWHPKGSRGEPLIVIDGIEITWDEFAQTILTHEGFRFRLEFLDT